MILYGPYKNTPNSSKMFDDMESFKNILGEINKTENIDFDQLSSQMKSNIKNLSVSSLNLIDRELFEEIKELVSNDSITLNFGKTLRDITCIIQDDGLREHELSILYKAPQKLSVVSVNLPHSTLQEREYKTLEEIITTFRSYVDSLSSYFYELERIDRFCTVVEPFNPTFKDEYRKILLDDRTWLHVEVNHEGVATNLHLIGQSDMWQDKLQAGLLSWDHDKDIVENIMNVFDIAEFPVANSNFIKSIEESQSMDKPVCGICLCEELPDELGLPQPLCQNSKCGVYFHKSCLFQWLVACSGSRPPAFGVATGACPTCLQPISCNA